MPGILPMKVIKIGSNAQTRIAQACDRCRSKKIRCDGIRPCCSQCANVGFECKTSDKLSRRAFPRGYTESLEERVRVLEAEVRELKDLLDEKDEKIDVLSRIHSQSPRSLLHASPRRQSNSSTEPRTDEPTTLDDIDECFATQQSSCVMGDASDAWVAGESSTSAFLECFRERAAQHGHILEDLKGEELLPTTTIEMDSPAVDSTFAPIYDAPPRLISDQLVNIFFQEWAPLFPVYHRPSFLAIYGRSVADPDSISETTDVACLSLVFAIAAASRGTEIEQLLTLDSMWMKAIDALSGDHTVEALQVLVLAQIRCLQCNDLPRLRSFKNLAAMISTELELHQHEASTAFDTLACETRKRLFWTNYTVDCFSSVVLGLPLQHVDDKDVSCDFPTDADDEYISEHGIQPSLPGESTKLSSALALFQAARILSRVLQRAFPTDGTHELSLKQLADLTDELELWEASLPSHLRLTFAQDKPSTGTITSRSPILSLVYHYIRALIQRPAIVAPSLGNKASSAIMIHASSCKRMVQILQLLKERSLTFSFCLDQGEVLLLCGLGTLCQRLTLGTASKILKDNSNTVGMVHQALTQYDSTLADRYQTLIERFIPDFKATSSQIQRARVSTSGTKPSISRNDSDVLTLPEHTNSLPSSTRRQLKAIASRFSAIANANVPMLGPQNGPVSVETPSLQPKRRSDRAESFTAIVRPSPSIAATRSDASLSPTLPASRSLSGSDSRPRCALKGAKRQTMPARTNLDYLSFGNEPEQNAVADLLPVKTEPQPTEWEQLLGDLDNGSTNIFDASYGGRPIEALAEVAPLRQHAERTAISDAALAWNAGLLTLQDPTNKRPRAAGAGGSESNRASNSVWSASSDEGRRSLDDPSFTDWTSASSINDAQDTSTKLDLTYVNVAFDFDAELGIDWQNDLVTNEA